MPAFFQTLEKLKPVYDWAYKIMLFICKLLLYLGDRSTEGYSLPK